MLPSANMEQETKKMEDRLVILKQFCDEEKDKDQKRLIEKKGKTRFDNQKAPIRRKLCCSCL